MTGTLVLLYVVPSPERRSDSRHRDSMTHSHSWHACLFPFCPSEPECSQRPWRSLVRTLAATKPDEMRYRQLQCVQLYHCTRPSPMDSVH